ncbi:MAG: hypothetical protein QOJ06_2500 [Pseudonocardiales bacterium]|jgi:hypothetical protein|nr:hypothetical protein [Pseudonocardiales bacterium]
MPSPTRCAMAFPTPTTAPPCRPDCPPPPYWGPATSLPATDELVAQLHHRPVIIRVIPAVKHGVVQLQHRGEIKET